MKRTHIFKAMTAAIGLAVLAVPQVAGAQSPAEFYKGKDVTLLVGSGAGGGYDVYARQIARHWSKHIPGHPNIVVKNMPVASGVVMMNHLANKAKRDGTVFAAAVAASVIDPVSGDKAFKYDPRKMSWIGNVSPQYTACFVHKNRSVNTIEEAMQKEVIVAATSSRSSGAVLPNVFNELMGTKFKVVTGYSTAGMTLAVERGEAHGACISYVTMIARNPELVERNVLNWLIVLNTERVKNLPDTPPASDFMKSTEARQILDLLIARVSLGRPYVAPPGVPADRLEVLRTSFFETLKDPAFLAEAKKLKFEIDPADHSEMEKTIAHVFKTPENVVKTGYDMMLRAKAAAKAAPNVKKKK